MKKLSLVLAIGLSLVLMAGGAFAASDTKTLTINAAVNARATLTLGQSTIHFPDADPDSGPVGATENPVSVTASVRQGASQIANLTCLASSDLTSGSDTIAISDVSWVAGGNGFVGGTMSKASAQSAGSWTGSGSRSSTFSYSLANRWSYATGNYTAQVVYTLSTP